MQGPETRPSLIGKLRDPASHDAWAEFVSLYQPIVYRVARQRGLQHADAEDLIQDVFATVGRKVGEFDFQHGGSFRGWLMKIARDLVVNKLTRGPRDIGSGDSDVHVMLGQQLDQNKTLSLLRVEHQRALLARAAERMRDSVSRPTWDAFWLTAVEGNSIAQVAERLGKTEGAVRVARCRVLAQLRKEVQSDDCPFSL
ncbi:sigma-70 family RNA polymerase sigma factor [Stieleria sp. TO1_6]|uniref:sigma-70 family RNA polymerase sigma factor n=1 Tax=Stieleria tagensis TaxID=2956795 RepID=UPI00209B1022|nr:sigma-70 family RNA polymerase sigma factor [Stieleria tagensis]MCO8123515.1 sigma-70 family RNA polymerase sigma factor [Stieleria tagensis]